MIKKNSAKLFFLLFLAAVSVYAAGEVDPAFNAGAYTYSSSGARVLTVQPDGKILVGGSFTVVHGVAHHALVRINPDGSLDPSFDGPPINPAILTPVFGGRVTAIAVQTDGKILVGGAFNVVGSIYRNFMRLNPDGSIDNTFPDFNGSYPPIEKIVVLPDNKFLVLTGTVAKYNANGVPDPEFLFAGAGTFWEDLEVAPDGKFFVCEDGVAKYNANGSRDNTFSLTVPNGTITDIALQADGKVVVGGDFTTLGGSSAGNVARLNTNGSRDTTFNTGGSGTNDQIDDVEIAPDGAIFINGEFTRYNSHTTIRVAKLNTNGTVDNTFVSTLSVPIQNDGDIAILPGNKVVVAGNGMGSIAGVATSLALLNSNGARDNDFIYRSGSAGRIRKTAQQTDGKIIVAGEFPFINGTARNSMARLNADGSLDAGFVPFFNNFPARQVIYALAALPDGKILAGASGGFLLSRLNPDGSNDSTFITSLQSSSLIYDIFVQPDGKILIVGEIVFAGDSMRRVARLNADGSTDSTFNPPNQPNFATYRVIRQPDGKVLICGDFTQIGSADRGKIARLNADGTLDAGFNPPGGANLGVYDMDLQPDGKVVLGGAFTMLNNSTTQVRIGRLNPDGTLDTSFTQAADGSVNSVKIQSDGRILIGGVFTSVSGVPRNLLARLYSTGTLDNSFNASATATVLDINLQTDGKILLGGDFTEINGVSRLAVARLLYDIFPPRKLFDYDGDGKADISVFRPSENRWYVFRSSDFGVTQQVFAIAGDVPVPSDYDGDGRTDFAVFRPSSGDWWYLSSANGAQIFADWGENGDIPRPGDFDGDGKSDFIVFRPSTNFWHRITINGTISQGSFGLAGDKPVSGDFDGDGKVDNAVFRPSTGDWWYQSSINGAQLATRWGISTDIPAPADFDGDGRTDFAVYRPSTGVWYIINSSNGSFLIMNFGIAEDKPVPADYDGDGKADIAVFRPSTGTWYQMKTTEGFAAQQFGISTDIPTENAFVP